MMRGCKNEERADSSIRRKQKGSRKPQGVKKRQFTCCSETALVEDGTWTFMSSLSFESSRFLTSPSRVYNRI
jgi:hypothetical protein